MKDRVFVRIGLYYITTIEYITENKTIMEDRLLLGIEERITTVKNGIILESTFFYKRTYSYKIFKH